MFQDGSLQMLCTTTFILTAHAAQPDICLCLWFWLCQRQRKRCVNPAPLTTVNRLLKTWVSRVFQSNPTSWAVLLPKPQGLPRLVI
ncbi:hypothetical protein DER45DRAFT_396547 [Fusarium avenaceum]|nr:hypothetical protein DER45DRAFT_396547 [Fusarium avenaceum]